MLAKMNQMGIRQWTFFLTISLLGLCWCTAVIAGETKGGDSPQAVFKTAQAAGADKDFNILAKLTAPSERPMLAFGTDMGVGMFVGFYEGENADALEKNIRKFRTGTELRMKMRMRVKSYK